VPPPAVHCIIVHYATPGSVLRSIAALQASQAVTPSITVVDNATLHESDAAAITATGVKLIRNPTNIGFGAACNVGLRAGPATEWTLFLNPDVVVEPETLRATIAGIGAAVGGGCRLLREDGSIDPACKRRQPTPWNAMLRATGMARKFPRLDRYNVGDRSDADDYDTDALVGAFMLVRTSALLEVGGFDERFFMYAEDLDLCRRLVERYGPVRYVGSATARHVKGESAVAVAPEMRREFFRSMRQYVRKHYPPPVAIPLVAATLLWQLASARRPGVTPR
jgi:GT2 family glycosyltransferase